MFVLRNFWRKYLNLLKNSELFSLSWPIKSWEPLILKFEFVEASSFLKAFELQKNFKGAAEFGIRKPNVYSFFRIDCRAFDFCEIMIFQNINFNFQINHLLQRPFQIKFSAILQWLSPVSYHLVTGFRIGHYFITAFLTYSDFLTVFSKWQLSCNGLF